MTDYETSVFVDNQGRTVVKIPAHIRKKFDLTNKNRVKIETTKTRIIITPKKGGKNNRER